MSPGSSIKEGDDVTRNAYGNRSGQDPWTALHEEAVSGSALASSPDHGEAHWRAVAAVGQRLARFCRGTDPAFLLAFGMLHDCRRVNEDRDPDHGARAADLALASLPLRDILRWDDIQRLAYACLWHEKGMVEEDDHDIGACWDSDRYNLLRFGIIPERGLLSAPITDHQHKEMLARTRMIWRNPPDWDELIVAVSSDPWREPEDDPYPG